MTIKTAHKDQWERIEDPMGIHAIMSTQFLPKTYDGENSLFNKCCWENLIYA
jgi:hypothetical protein